jgi:hypothetical protein
VGKTKKKSCKDGEKKSCKDGEKKSCKDGEKKDVPFRFFFGFVFSNEPLFWFPHTTTMTMDSYATLDDIAGTQIVSSPQSVDFLWVENVGAAAQKVQKEKDFAGVKLNIEEMNGVSWYPLAEAIINGDSQWKESDLSRALSSGVVVKDMPPSKGMAGGEVQCTRIVDRSTTWHIGGEGDGSSGVKRQGYMWAAPATQLEAQIFLQYIHEFMTGRKHANDTRTLHVLVERADTSGMASDGTHFADMAMASRRVANCTLPSQPAAVLVDVCTNDATTQATCAIRSSATSRLEGAGVRHTLVCDSLFVNTQNNIKGAEGAWLAIGVSSTTNAVPRMLCGKKPTLWLGQRVRVNRVLRLDFADRSSLSIPDLFQWRTTSCSMTVHPLHADAPPDADVVLVASPFPLSDRVCVEEAIGDGGGESDTDSTGVSTYDYEGWFDLIGW